MINKLSKLKSNIVANYLGQAWAGIMALSFLPVYIDYLGVEAYGLIGFFTVLQTVLIFLDVGMTPTLNREMARFSAGEHSAESIRNLLRSLEIICFSIALLIAIGLWGASDYLASEWLNVEGLSLEVAIVAMSIMGVVVALRFCEGIYRGALFGLERQVWYNVAYAILTTLRYAGSVVVLAFVSNTVEAFFVWQGFISLLSLIVFIFSVYKSLPVTSSRARFSIDSISGVWKFASGMLGITALTVILLNTDKLLISSMVSLKEFGYYSLAATAASVLFMIVVPVTQAVFPHLVKLRSQDNYQQLANVYHMMTQLIIVLIAPVAIMLSIFSGGVVYMWSGNSDLSSNTAPLLSVLVLGCFLNGLAHIPYQLQLAHGWTSLLVKVNAIVVVGLVAGIFIFVPQYGLIGAAWIWTIVNAFYLILSTFFMHLRLLPGEKMKWYFSDILLPTSGALTLVLLALQFQPEPNHGRLYWFLFLFFTWVFASLLSVLLASIIRKQIKSILWNN